MMIRIQGLYLKSNTANSMVFQESKYQESKATQPKPSQRGYPQIHSKIEELYLAVEVRRTEEYNNVDCEFVDFCKCTLDA